MPALEKPEATLRHSYSKTQISPYVLLKQLVILSDPAHQQVVSKVSGL